MSTSPTASAAPADHPPRQADGAAPARRERSRHLSHFPLDWVAARWFLGAYVLFALVGIGVGELIVHPLRHSWLQHVDQSIEQWLARHRTPWLNTATFIGSELADTIVKIAITIVVAGGMLLVWRRWLAPLMVSMALILEAATFITVTWVVGRPRPAVPRLETSPVGSSFPSGHVAAAVVYGGIVAVVFWRTRRRWVRVMSVTIVALVASIAGFSRMYRGMHHLSDVVAGAILGLASVLVARAILLRTAACRPEEREFLEEGGEAPACS